MSKFDQLFEELNKHLDSTNQNWLFGAGISYQSNIPLMIPMTKKIEEDLLQDNTTTFLSIKEFLPVDSHIEHYLSHIGDLIALIERSNKHELTINNVTYNYYSLVTLYNEIISLIGDLVRYGYKESEKIQGNINWPIVEIKYHKAFVRTLFNRRSNLENITNINFFTTNYDTLLEDALALEKKLVIDGFTGGSMGFWNPKVFNTSYQASTFKLFKLHGSIDWHKDDENGLIRCRYGTKYLSDNSNLLIYPQATKYIETQKDPFAFLFNKFRESLNIERDNVLVTCGYSFGDNHINNEIEMSMSLPDNKTNLLIFIKESWIEAEDKTTLPEILIKWLDDSNFRNRVFVMSDQGLYNESSNIEKEQGENTYDWWTFEGLTNLLD
ncbi:SIR2 family protein [Salipaludibacillus neizhouensis]|uniref:SIR2 family protein n=1 Tax=Salipaludibacillus neizhouensis TaxID=885475 RepID=A0A3A9K183_9BACI|nr:SIR2 family protein [Salipaludibacillus neizhouensis]RKL66487.1 SIR2 family protein [Salipaludibacillus neizhouensis]